MRMRARTAACERACARQMKVKFATVYRLGVYTRTHAHTCTRDVVVVVVVVYTIRSRHKTSYYGPVAATILPVCKVARIA